MQESFTIIAYFIIYSFIGWILESVYKSILQKKIINSGFLHGPICPIYGYGAMIMYLSLRNVTNNLFLLFAFGVIVLSIFEYLVGVSLELAFKTKYWDYSKRKFNIQGRVCLRNSLYWGVLGIVFMRIIHPVIEKTVQNINPNVNIVLILILGTAIIADTIITVIGLIKINIKLEKLEELTKIIRENAEEINKSRIESLEKLNNRRIASIDKINNFRRQQNEKILNKIKEMRTGIASIEVLREKQEEVQRKLEKRIDRLRKTFPNMNSQKLTNFFNNSKKS